jgi:hypothetical protein
MMSITVQFNNVGNRKHSWVTQVANLSRLTLIDQIKKRKALLSNAIEIEWQTDKDADIVVGLRTVGKIFVMSEGEKA